MKIRKFREDNQRKQGANENADPNGQGFWKYVREVFFPGHAGDYSRFVGWSPQMIPRILAAVALFAFAWPASAASLCAPPKEIADHLDKRFGEHKGSWGTTLGGALIEVFESKQGTWTLVITQPNGLSCMMAAGQGGWHERPIAAPRGNRGI